MEDIIHVSTFKKVTLFLLETAEKEILHGDKPELIIWKGRARDFKKTLLNEIKRYVRQQYPFNQQIDSNYPLITWWQALQGSEHAQILPVSRTDCMKINATMTKKNSLTTRFLLSKYLLFVLIPCQRNGLYLLSHG